MEDTKSIFASKTFWAGTGIMAAGVASLLGYSLSPADQAQIAELGFGIANTVLGLIAIWGRVSATKRIQ